MAYIHDIVFYFKKFVEKLKKINIIILNSKFAQGGRMLIRNILLSLEYKTI